MPLEKMPDNHRWNMSPLVSCSHFPYNALYDPAIFETTEFGLVSPKFSKLIQYRLVLFACSWAVIDEAEGVLGVMYNSNENGFRS
jgi:hypothetical protein